MDSSVYHYCGFDPCEVAAYREVAVVAADRVAEAVRWAEKEGAFVDVHPNQVVVVEDASFSFQYSSLVAATVASVY
jgi:hypothetical protein